MNINNPLPRIKPDNALCRDCQLCALGCSLFHYGESSLSKAKIRVDKDMALYKFSINVCRQCKNPKCVEACPVGAILLNDQGYLILSQEKCTKCGECAKACPFKSIYFSVEINEYQKCDMCFGRENGPVCVEICPVHALEKITLDKSKDNK